MNIKRIIIILVFVLLLIDSMFSRSNMGLEQSRARFWKSSYEELWAFAKMVEIPVRQIEPNNPLRVIQPQGRSE